MGAPDFWDDAEAAQALNQELADLKGGVDTYNALVAKTDDLMTLWEMGMEEKDEAVEADVKAEYESLKNELRSLELELLLSGEYDANNAYDEAGVKSVMLFVKGHNAYGYLKSEKGVHRLVRISPFDSNARRHTSFSACDVMPEMEDAKEVEIDMDDVRVDTYRSSGAGGQHINKTSSAVRMTHMPTGIVVQCQNERSQIQNREVCLRMLRAKLFELEEKKKEEERAKLEGVQQKIEWGSQIRSYVFQPYTMVKDHRTGEETGNVQAVMDGEIDPFIESFLAAKANHQI